MHLHCEWLMISSLYFMYNVHDGTSHLFINSVRFIVEKHLHIIIYWYCCGMGFWLKRWAMRTTKRSKLWSYCSFWDTYWKCCPILFRVFLVFLTYIKLQSLHFTFKKTGSSPRLQLFYMVSHLSELQSCTLLFSTNFYFIFIIKYCTTQFSYWIVYKNKMIPHERYIHANASDM